MRRLLMVVLCGTFVLGNAVAGWSKSETVWTNYRLNKVRITDLKRADRKAIQPAHPVELSQNKLREVMESIELQRRSFGSKKVKSLAVFDPESIDALLPHLTAALQQVTDKQIIEFSFLVNDPTWVFRRNRLTTGKLWVAADGVHVLFNKMYADITIDTDKRGTGSKQIGRAQGLRVTLSTGPGQKFGNSTSELVVGLDTTLVATGRNTEKIDHTERLSKIKKLYEMELITKEEYEAKRLRIVNEL